VSSQYPKDEFDRAGEDMPVGMHRPQPSRWRSVLPFLAILIIVPLLGWGASQLLTNQGGNQSDTATVPQSQPSAQSEGTTQSDTGEQSSPSATPEPTETPTPTETETSEPATVDHNVVIAVLNGTLTQGYAAEVSGQLATAGFPATSAANAQGWAAQVSTVYYADPDLQATAEEIARVVGIGAVETASDADLGGADVVVLLR